jgi:hypothetical protein
VKGKIYLISLSQLNDHSHAYRLAVIKQNEMLLKVIIY